MLKTYKESWTTFSQPIGRKTNLCNGLCGLMLPEWDDDTPQVSDLEGLSSGFGIRGRLEGL